MSKPTEPSQEALTGDELAQQTAAPLPDREAMSTITGSGVDNFAVPINEAVAANLNSTDSYAIADADQIVILNQVDVDGPDEPTAPPVHGGDVHDKHPFKD